MQHTRETSPGLSAHCWGLGTEFSVCLVIHTFCHTTGLGKGALFRELGKHFFLNLLWRNLQTRVLTVLRSPQTINSQLVEWWFILCIDSRWAMKNIILWIFSQESVRRGAFFIVLFHWLDPLDFNNNKLHSGHFQTCVCVCVCVCASLQSRHHSLNELITNVGRQLFWKGECNKVPPCFQSSTTLHCWRSLR